MEKNVFKELRDKIDELDSMLIAIQNDEYGKLDDLKDFYEIKDEIDDLQYETTKWLEEHESYDESVIVDNELYISQ
jgi:hypothetical protein